MRQASKTHLVLIPTYNTGPIVLDVVKEALKAWQPVYVVVDGSNNGTEETLAKLADIEPHLTVIHYNENKGKGSAIYTGMKAALANNFTHILTMDADGQHPAAAIKEFMELSVARPDTLVLGVPVFDADAPALRVNGRKISNFWANLETLWMGINDSLFGFRVYPIKALKTVMDATIFARRFDFEPEVAVKMVWNNVPVINQSAPVRYLSAEEGGVSQFKYVRDNILLTWMHTRLFLGFLILTPVLIWRHFQRIGNSFILRRNNYKKYTL